MYLDKDIQYIYEDESQIDAIADAIDHTSVNPIIGYWVDFARNGDIIATVNYNKPGGVQSQITSYAIIHETTLKEQTILNKLDIVRIYPGDSLQSSLFARATTQGLQISDINDKPVVTISYELMRSVYYAFRGPSLAVDASSFRSNSAYRDQFIIAEDFKYVLALNANGLNKHNTYAFYCR